jgi:hypothetical protein
MALNDIIALGVQIASSVTDSLKPNVTHEAWIGQNATGKPSYASPVTLRCIIDDSQKNITTLGGSVITVMATLTFLDPITPNGTSGRREPIDPRDRFTLPNGFTGKIIDSPGSVINPATGVGFIQQIMLGR